MKEFKASTKRGKQLMEMGDRCCRHTMSDIYKTWSPEKQRAFDWCWEQYCNDSESSYFGIGNANNYGFTASWLLVKDGEECMRIETKSNSYLIYLHR